jgi:hypothetical protein
MTKYSYDEKCEMLARFFLADFPQHTEDEVRELAQQIQNAIEGYLSSKGYE